MVLQEIVWIWHVLRWVFCSITVSIRSWYTRVMCIDTKQSLQARPSWNTI